MKEDLSISQMHIHTSTLIYMFACVLTSLCTCMSSHFAAYNNSIPITGYFRGVCILRISKLLRFVELIFSTLIENHTHIPSVATSRVQFSRKFSFHVICENIHPSKITCYIYGNILVHYYYLSYFSSVKGLSAAIEEVEKQEPVDTVQKNTSVSISIQGRYNGIGQDGYELDSILPITTQDRHNGIGQDGNGTELDRVEASNTELLAQLNDLEAQIERLMGNAVLPEDEDERTAKEAEKGSKTSSRTLAACSATTDRVPLQRPIVSRTGHASVGETHQNGSGSIERERRERERERGAHVAWLHSSSPPRSSNKRGGREKAVHVTWPQSFSQPSSSVEREGREKERDSSLQTRTGKKWRKMSR